MENFSNKDSELTESGDEKNTQAEKIIQLNNTVAELSDDYHEIEVVFQQYPPITRDNELYLTRLRIFLYRKVVLHILSHLKRNILPEEIFDEMHKDFVALFAYEKVMLVYLQEMTDRARLSIRFPSAPNIDQESVHKKISNHNIQRHKDCLQVILKILEELNQPIELCDSSNRIVTGVLKDSFDSKLLSRRKQAAELDQKIVNLGNDYRKLIGSISLVACRNEAMIMLYVLILYEIHYRTFWNSCGGSITLCEWLKVVGYVNEAIGEAKKYYHFLDKAAVRYVIDEMNNTTWAVVHFVDWYRKFLEDLNEIKACHPEIDAK